MELTLLVQCSAVLERIGVDPTSEMLHRPEIIIHRLSPQSLHGMRRACYRLPRDHEHVSFCTWFLDTYCAIPFRYSGANIIGATWALSTWLGR
jgi:hypothetical protein